MQLTTEDWIWCISQLLTWFLVDCMVFISLFYVSFLRVYLMYDFNTNTINWRPNHRGKYGHVTRHLGQCRRSISPVLGLYGVKCQNIKPFKPFTYQIWTFLMVPVTYPNSELSPTAMWLQLAHSCHPTCTRLMTMTTVFHSICCSCHYH